MSLFTAANITFLIICGDGGHPGIAISTLTRCCNAKNDECCGCAFWPPLAYTVNPPVHAHEPKATNKSDYSLASLSSLMECSSSRHTDPSINTMSIFGISQQSTKVCPYTMSTASNKSTNSS